MLGDIRSNLYFGLTVLMLVGSAASLQAAKRRGSLVVLKKPLPLRRPLADFDRDAIVPYEVARAVRLPSSITEDLGTEEYINWALRLPGRRRAKNREVALSVTYYTDVQDQVPHVPEECYFQGMFMPAGDKTLEVRLDRLGRTVPVRRLAFFPPREFVKKDYVYYTICVNGEFRANRDLVRLRMADPRDTHLYYSKVEIAFRSAGDQGVSVLDARAQRLLDRILVELVNSHWPERGTERGGVRAGVGAGEG